MATHESASAAACSRSLAVRCTQALLGLALTVQGTPAAFAASPGGEHYQCYRARNAGPGRFTPREVTLEDRFETKRTEVRRPAALCNPTDKNGEGMVDPTAHLACYDIEDAPGQPAFRRREVTVTDQFGELTLRLRRPERLCVPSEKNGVASARAIDHYKCYRASRAGGVRFAPREVTLADQFGEIRAMMHRPVEFCTPVDTQDAEMFNRARHLTCYEASPRAFPRTSVTITNDFEVDERLRVFGRARLCVPSVGAVCGDGILEPTTEECDDGRRCTDGTPCTDDPAACAGIGDGTCAARGCCSAGCRFLAAGTACEDGNQCTSGDRCDAAGTCLPGLAVACIGNQCSDASCDPATGRCASTPKPDGTPCDDGEPCTHADVCRAGTCAGEPAVCTPGPCQEGGTCNPETGACEFTPKAVSTPCDDGDGCTLDDACNTAGACVGSRLVCLAPDQCNVGVCDPATGACRAEPKANGTPCDDLAVCTGNDACVDGDCRGTSLCVSSACIESICTPSGCLPRARNEGGPCDDGDLCTTNDRCDATGGCAGTNDCAGTVADQCNDGVCDPATGQCRRQPKPNGTACDDVLACTSNDGCVDGACRGTSVCASTPCITSTCTPSGCLPVVRTGEPCDDGVACTSGDTCAANGLCSGTDTCVSSPCQSCACSPVAGCLCLDLPCTDDGNPCTSEVCDPERGCHQPVQGLCDDRNDCTGPDFCSNGQCVGLPVFPPPSCSDGNSCTSGDHCSGGVCVGSPQCNLGCFEDAACDDGIACTDDQCTLTSPTTVGCLNLPDPDHCAEQTAEREALCRDRFCRAGGVQCLETCPAGSECVPCGECVLQGSCDPDAGTSHGCTTNFCCDAFGECIDGNPCTADFCAENGCVHVPVREGQACCGGFYCSYTFGISDGVCENGECVCGPGGSPGTCQ